MEPIPKIFATLCENIKPYPEQKAVKALCAARDGEVVKFNISSNMGASSSMLQLGKHASLYPDVVYTDQIEIASTRLDSLFAGATSEKYNLLVLDVQAPNWRCSRGGDRTLREMDGVYLEVSEDPLYEGGCALVE